MRSSLAPVAPGSRLRSLAPLLTCGALLLAGCADGPVAWVVQAGPDDADLGLPRELPSGDLVVGGMLSDESLGEGNQAILVWLSADGDEQATRTYPALSFVSAVPGPDGRMAFSAAVYQGAGYEPSVGVMSAEGDIEWQFPLSSGGIDQVNGVAWSDDGGVLAWGSTSGNIPFGELTIDGDTSGRGFVAALDADGEPGWLFMRAGPDADAVFALARREDGSLLVSGRTGDYLSPDGFVTALDSADGHELWATQVPGATVASLGLSPDGTIRATGDASYDILVLALDSSGNQLSRQTIASTLDAASDQGGSSFGTSMSVSPSGRVLLGGSFEGTLDLGLGEPMSAQYGTDAFLVELSPDGAPVAQLQAGGTGSATVAAFWAADGDVVAAFTIATDGDRTFHVGGHELDPRGRFDTAIARLRWDGLQ